MRDVRRRGFINQCILGEVAGEVWEMSGNPKKAMGEQKPQLQLIPPALNRETAKALSLGAKKYGPWNWRENRVEIMTYLGAIKRHIDCILSGEDIDPESGAHHLGHVAAGCAIVLDAAEHGMLVDNRPRRPREPECSGTKGDCKGKTG